MGLILALFLAGTTCGPDEVGEVKYDYKTGECYVVCKKPKLV